MKYQGKSMMSLNEMVRLAIEYEGDGYVTGYPIVSGNDAYILNGVIEANEEYITINQWVPVFPESLKPVSPSLTTDQQVVLDYLISRYHNRAFPFDLVGGLNSRFFSGPDWETDKVLKAYGELNSRQQFQVLAAFAEWGLSTLDN
ncbi:hypothetical protein ACH0F8_000577 [Enterococcus hirae]